MRDQRQGKTIDRIRGGVLGLAAAALAVALLAAPTALAKKHHPKRGPRIAVLSNRADLISGGNALVAIDLPRGLRASKLRVHLRGRNVKREFAFRANGRYEALLTGLRVGPNKLVAAARGRRTARLTIVNHANGGPVTSGPQVKPWVCQNGSRQPKCGKAPTYEYQYMSQSGGGFQPYDPKNPPGDVATTTTQTGAKVPFIIRIETGYQDRDQYKIAALFQPGKSWHAWAPQRQFNHKLVITHGASCAINHESAEAPSVTGDTVAGDSPTYALGKGFVVMSTALDNAGHNCSIATEAESLIMAKERVVEQYGTLRYTIGEGCSGGSLVQQQVANAYPGIYQGILPQCSFPDGWSTGQQLAAYHFTRGYFEHPEKWGPGVVWTPSQIGAVEGHPNHGNAIIFDTNYWNGLANPSGPVNGTGVSSGCSGVKQSQEYDAKTRPAGVRCTLADYMINVFGPRPKRLWTPNEKKLGHGFAGLAVGDVGVQFGLQALRDGTISPAQFVDLNDKIGGADIDLNYTHARSQATQPAVRNAYRSGAINEANNLTSVAIIDLRGPDPGAFHDAYRSWVIRARLEAAEHHFPRNHVIWFGEVPLIGDPSYTTLGLQAEDRWLARVEHDRRHVSLARKVQGDRPVDVHDICTNIPGVEQTTGGDGSPICQNKDVQTRYATPAMVAGEPINTDVQRCHLEQLKKSDYYPYTFTNAQWSTLEKVFPTGVCDFTDKGASQQPTIPWMSYQRDARGDHVIYGGRPLGQAPAHSGGGWTSGVFSVWRKGKKGWGG